MTKEEFLSILANANTVIFSLLGKNFRIKSWSNGIYSIEDNSKNDVLAFSSAFELIESYRVMNMSLESLTPWMNVTAVA